MTQNLPDPVRKLAHALAELPGIGPRQATRLAIHLASQDATIRKTLGNLLSDMGKVKLCVRCYFMHEREDDLCSLCSDPSRDPSIIMIVEKETDLISLENTKKFKGQYLIIGPIPKIGALADSQRMRLKALKAFITAPSPVGLDGEVKEIILGFNPSSVGDLNARILAKELEEYTKKITRLGRGLPTGGEIEFADDETLGGALEGRG